MSIEFFYHQGGVNVSYLRCNEEVMTLAIGCTWKPQEATLEVGEYGFYTLTFS